MYVFPAYNLLRVIFAFFERRLIQRG